MSEKLGKRLESKKRPLREQTLFLVKTLSPLEPPFGHADDFRLGEKRRN